MNNKMIKKNLLLFVSLAAAAVVALGLLIYVAFLVFEWNSFWTRTDNARSKISRLLKQNPRPGKENELRVQHDVEIYKMAAEGLRKQFKSPLQPAMDAFFAALQPPLISALSEEEKEQFKVPGTGVEADPDESIKAVPLKIRKLNQQGFCDFFRGKFEKYCEENGKNEEERLSMATLNEFMASSLGFFPKGNWADAVKAFTKIAGTLTFEPVNDSNQIAVLLAALGFPRRVADDPQALQRHVDDMIAAIGRNASENKLVFAPQALTFVGGMSGVSGSGSMEALPLKDYPMALFHWDVFGDIVNRLGQAKATSLQQIVLRTAAAEEGESDRSGRGNTVNLESSFEQIGNFRIYHYTVVFTAPMDVVRNVVRTFDQANKDNRTYVVRSLCFYAKENGAAVVMEQKSSEEVDNSSSVEEREEPVRRVRRRRSRRRVEEPEVRQEVKKESEDVQAQIAAREAALPAHQRSDYGMIRIGGDAECIVYMDIDYVVLGANQ